MVFALRILISIAILADIPWEHINFKRAVIEEKFILSLKREGLARQEMCPASSKR